MTYPFERFLLSAVIYKEVLSQVEDLDSKIICGIDWIGPEIVKSCR